MSPECEDLLLRDRQLLDRQRGRQLDLSLAHGRLGVGGGSSRELGANRRLLLRSQDRHGVAGGVPAALQEVEDVASLDPEVASQLLDFDAARLCGGDGYSFVFELNWE